MKNYLRYGSKYNAVPTLYKGRTYHSKVEAKDAAELDLLLKAKEIKHWEPQYKLPLNVGDKRIGYIIVDFYYIDKNGQEYLKERKGFRQPLWQWKWKHLKAQYGKKYKYEVV